MVQVRRAFRIRLQVLAAAAGSLTLLGAILAFAYTTFQNDVDGVPIPSRWPNGSFTWVLDNPGSPPGNVDITDGIPIKTVLINSFNSWTTASLNGQQLTNLSISNGNDVTNLPDPQIDCVNVVSFNENNPADFPTGTAAIAFTTVSTDYLRNGAPGAPGTTYTLLNATTLKL